MYNFFRLSALASRRREFISSKPNQDAADWRLENEEEDSGYWTSVIRPRSPWFHLDLHELWNYRDLILLFVRRDFVAQYKQTILGPLWFFLQPLFTTIVFTVVFGRIARIPTDGIPDFLFYLSGTVCWAYFAVCLTETSDTFFKNAQIFGKVFFPRSVVPVSIVISNVLKFVVQFSLFPGRFGILCDKGRQVRPNLWIVALPVVGASNGVARLGMRDYRIRDDNKIRDLSLLVTFGVQLWMYATPVVYPLSQIPEAVPILLFPESDDRGGGKFPKGVSGNELHRGRADSHFVGCYPWAPVSRNSVV